MKQNIRTFVALDVGKAVRETAGELIGEFSGIPADVKWVDPENMHLTLKFLGDVDAREVHHVCGAVREAARGVEPFKLEIRGTGAFPNARRPRTIWLGAGEGAEQLGVLAERIESALEKLGYRREARHFSAHLTIGRIRRGGPGVTEIGELIRKYADFDVGRAALAEAVVFSSELTRSGPIYEVLSRAALGNG
jgi:2'-5' RNA ligase